MSDQTPPNSANRPIIGFVAGTPLLTPEGAKPIEQIQPGDLIPGKPGEEIHGVFVRHKPIFRLHLAGQVVRTTGDHPFCVQGKGWTAVAHLQVGDLLPTRDGQDVRIEAVTASAECQESH